MLDAFTPAGVTSVCRMSFKTENHLGSIDSKFRKGPFLPSLVGLKKGGNFNNNNNINKGRLQKYKYVIK